MSKFVLRNLKNERRRVEKQLKKIDRQIERIENTRVIAEGTLDLNTLVRFDKSILDIKGDKVDTTLRFKIKFEGYKKEVTCTLTMLKTGKQFIGKARCAKEDSFDLATGMCLAEDRAIKAVYEYIIEQYA